MPDGNRVNEIFHAVVGVMEEDDNVFDVVAALGMSISFFLESIPPGARQNFAQGVCNTMMGTLGALDDMPSTRMH